MAREVKTYVCYGSELRHKISISKRTAKKDGGALGTRELGKAAEGRMQEHRSSTLN